MNNDTKTQNFKIPDDIAHLLSTTFKNDIDIDFWLVTPLRALNGATPIAKLKTDEGISEVRAILHKIKNGEFP